MKKSLDKFLMELKENRAKKIHNLRRQLGLTAEKEDEPPPARVKLKTRRFEKPLKAKKPMKVKKPRWALSRSLIPRDGLPEYKSAFDSGYAFIHFLQKRGFKYLGSGAFSTVLGKEGSDRVVKVTRTNDNWIDYIQWAAKKGYCGTFAPRVYSYKTIKTKDGKEFYVSVVERMEKTASYIESKEDLAIVSGMLEYHSRGNVMAGVYLEDLVPGIVKFETELRTHFQRDTQQDAYGGRRSRLDYHGGNFMVRKDGSFCFTDPVCGNRETTTNRLKAGDFTPAAAINGLRIEYCYRH